MYKFPSVPAYTFTGKPRNGMKNDKPGPGAYEVDTSDRYSFKKSPAAAMSKAPRGVGNKSDGPGPGAYDGGNIFAKVKGGFMGGRHGGKGSSELPGPGAYDNSAVSWAKNNGGYSFGKGRLGSGHGTSLSPGPGAYYQDDHSNKGLNKSTGNVLSRAARNMMKSSDTPGPGAYEADSNLLRNRVGPVQGKAARDALYNKHGSPVGPGGYDVSREFDNKHQAGGKFGKAPRYKDGSSELPGPGAYESGEVFDKFSYKRTGAKFGKSPRTNAANNSMPGPGAYELGDGIGKSAKAYISKHGRDGLRPSDIPGPGAYEDGEAYNRAVSAKGGPKFSKAEKHSKNNDVPGPGAYDNLSSIVDNKSGVKFGKNSRMHGISDDKPGPGAYDQEGNYGMSKPKYSFGKAPRDKAAKNDTPFYYDLPPSIPDVAKYNYPEVERRKIHL